MIILVVTVVKIPDKKKTSNPKHIIGGNVAVDSWIHCSKGSGDTFKDLPLFQVGPPTLLQL